MQAKPSSPQGELFSIPLKQIIDVNHPLYRFADSIDWACLDNVFSALYSPGKGRPAKPTRLPV